jgi:hypothetical protein
VTSGHLAWSRDGPEVQPLSDAAYLFHCCIFAAHIRKITLSLKALHLIPASHCAGAESLIKQRRYSDKRYFIYTPGASRAQQITYILKIGYG